MKKWIIIFIICILAIVTIVMYTIKIGKNENFINQNGSNETIENKLSDSNYNESKENYKELLLKVLNNESKLVDEKNNEILFENFEIPGEKVTKADKYVFIDLNKDGIQELAIYTTADYGAYIILHYENDVVYGYLIGVRSFENLKTDGSFIGSNGANSNEYLTMSFNKNTYNLNKEAIYDGTSGEYKIGSENVSKEKIDEYIETWNKKQDVEWIKNETNNIDGNFLFKEEGK